MKRWNALGLLIELDEKKAFNTALCYEEMANFIINKEIRKLITSEYEDKICTIIFPLIRILCEKYNFKWFNIKKLYKLTIYNLIYNTILFNILKDKKMNYLVI